MGNKNIRYVHEEIVHNFKAANEVVPFIVNLLDPKSVVDVGCGIGTWLKVFRDNGINDILGVDGDYVDKKLLKISVENFIDFDLEKLYKSEKKYDLAISLEVAEHLSFESSDIFVKTLCDLSDTIIFSAAIPDQGGQNHINEQEPKYWIEKFENEGFRLFDILRPVFWDNQNVDSWYRQNMLLFTKNVDLKAKLNSLESFTGKHLVHPVLSKGKDGSLIHYKNQLERINSGNKDVRFYLNLLLKVLKRKFR
ncbi:class I SAM-dependent methyltransferase [Flavobacterium rhamnosiphilum]|nr:methyltransferase domain-containing protein [Flavobacterium rhamnosiphilum]